MSIKDKAIRLRTAGVRNCEIAKVLGVSKQYISRVCRTSQETTKETKVSEEGGFVTVGGASRIFGVSETKIRRWADQGKIPSFRIDGGRRYRRFRLSDVVSMLDKQLNCISNNQKL